MRKNTLLLLTIGLSLSMKAQEIKYFNDNTFTTEVSKDEAFYQRTSSLSGDTIINQNYDLKSGSLLSVQKLLNNKPVGIWTNYSFDGKVINTRNFNVLNYTNEKPEGVFSNTPNEKLEGFSQAEYPGGMGEFQKFIATKLIYPDETIQANNTGTIFIQFIIDEKGNATPYSIVRGVDNFIDFEVWRLFEKMPIWKPATKDGKPVKSIFTLPIRIS